MLKANRQELLRLKAKIEKVQGKSNLGYNSFISIDSTLAYFCYKGLLLLVLPNAEISAIIRNITDTESHIKLKRVTDECKYMSWYQEIAYNIEDVELFKQQHISEAHCNPSYKTPYILKSNGNHYKINVDLFLTVRKILGDTCKIYTYKSQTPSSKPFILISDIGEAFIMPMYSK